MATLGARAKSARRAAQRRIVELSIQLDNASSTDTKVEISRRITRMEELISQTRMYEGGKRIVGRTVDERKAAVTELEDLNKDIKLSRTSGVRASNSVFMKNIYEVSHGSKIDEMTEGEMRSFWRATQKTWEGRAKTTADRYGLIKDYYGTSNLKDIFDAIVALNSDKIELLSVIQEGGRLTDEQKELAQSIMRSDDEMVKKYSKNEDSPLVGAVRSSIPEMTKRDFQTVIGAIRALRAGNISEDLYNDILNEVRNS